MGPSSRLLTLDQSAAYLTVSKRWMRRAVERKTLPCIKLGHLVRFDVADLEAYLAEQRVEANVGQEAAVPSLVELEPGDDS